jgi:hypothetical protein
MARRVQKQKTLRSYIDSEWLDGRTQAALREIDHFKDKWPYLIDHQLFVLRQLVYDVADHIEKEKHASKRVEKTS